MDLTLDQLKEAVSLREQIQVLESRIHALLGGVGGGNRSSGSRSSGGGSKQSAETRAPRSGGRRPMSAATRAKLSAAARARWARQGKGSSTLGSTPANAGAKKRKSGGLTAAGRRRLSESMKARWAARRAS